MFTPEEKEIICVSLNMRSNYIQTGSISLSPLDVHRIGAEHAKREFNAEIKPLSIEQMDLIVKTDRLMKKILNS